MPATTGFENWARRLWSIYALEGNHPYDALDYYPILQLPDGQLENGEKFVHLVIVGFSGMGQALLLEALRVCHYANYDDTQPEADRLRTQITVIDKDMDALLPHFKLMFPHLDSQVDDLHIEYLDAMSRNLLRDELPSYVNQHYEDSIKNPPTSFISILHAYHVEGREMEYNLEATRVQISWINLGENYRWANRYQIEAYQTYLSTLGYAIARQLPAGRRAGRPLLLSSLKNGSPRNSCMPWSVWRSIVGMLSARLRDGKQGPAAAMFIAFTICWCRIICCPMNRNSRIARSSPSCLTWLNWRASSCIKSASRTRRCLALFVVAVGLRSKPVRSVPETLLGEAFHVLTSTP